MANWERIFSLISVIILGVVIVMMLALFTLLEHWTDIVVFVFVLLFLIALLYLVLKGRRTKPPQSSKEIIEHIKWQKTNVFIFDHIAQLFVRRTHYRHYFRTSYEKDQDDILAFDKYIRRGESVCVPQMRTERGKKLWKQYIDAYNAEHSEPVQTDEVQEPLPAGSWLCTCGRENPYYTSTCVCGINKRDI